MSSRWLACGSPARLIKTLTPAQIAGKRESTDRYVLLGVRCGRELRHVTARRPPGVSHPRRNAGGNFRGLTRTPIRQWLRKMPLLLDQVNALLEVRDIVGLRQVVVDFADRKRVALIGKPA